MGNLVAGDTGTVIQITCIDVNGNVIDLTGQTVKFIWKIDQGAKTTSLMTVSAPTTGVATYQFTAGQLAAGTMSREFEIDGGGGTVLSSRDIDSEAVRPRLT